MSETRRAGMYVLGVTGGMGSGKTTVSQILARNGARVLDADRVVRSLYDGGELPRLIEERWGPGMLTETGAVDRGALARIVFSDPAARRELESLVHPRVRAEIVASLERWREEGFTGLAVVDAALLVEASPPYPLDGLAVVSAPEELRETRLTGRGVERAEARRRMAAQSSEEEKLRRADFVIRNTGSFEDLEAEVHLVLGDLTRDGRTRSE